MNTQSNFQNLLLSSLGTVHNAGYTMVSGDPNPLIRSARAVSDSMSTIINVPQEDGKEESRCRRFAKFLYNNKVLVAMGVATTALAGYLFYQYKNSESSLHVGNETGSELGGAAQALRGGNIVKEPTPIRAVQLYIQKSDKSSECTGSALAGDTILTAAHCVTDFDRSGGLTCRFPNGTAIPNDILKQMSLPELAEDHNYDDTTSSPSSSTLADDDLDYSEFESMDDSIMEIYESMECDPYPITSVPADNIIVRYGNQQSKEFLQKSYQATAVVYHPGYSEDANGTANDIALIKLAQPIENIPLSVLPTKQTNARFREQVQANGDGSAPKYPQNLYVQGWGVELNPNFTPADEADENESFTYEPQFIATENLKEGNITAVAVDVDPDVDCEKVICNYEISTEICTGDSGGPSYFNDPVDDKLIQVGVGSESSSDCNQGQSIFVDVYQHDEWIKQQMEKLGTDTKERNIELQKQQASRGFGDYWNPSKGSYTRVDCNSKKIESLRTETLKAMAETKQCESSNGTSTQSCQAQTERSQGYKQAFDFRIRNCVNSKIDNRQGLKLTQRFNLQTDQRPTSDLCFITNKNDRASLKFTPSQDLSQAITIRPKQTVQCPEKDGVPLTEGRVTRPRKQTIAWLDSAPSYKPKKPAGSYIRVEKYGTPGSPDYLVATKCDMRNGGAKGFKFHPDDNQGSDIVMMPEATGQCAGANGFGIDGIVKQLGYTDFPTVSFQQIASLNSGEVRIQLNADIETQGKGFLLNDDETLIKPTMTADQGDKKQYTFTTNVAQVTSVRVIDASLI